MNTLLLVAAVAAVATLAARNQMDALATRTRVVSRKLRDVGELPEADAKLLLKLAPSAAAADEEEDGWVEAQP